MSTEGMVDTMPDGGVSDGAARSAPMDARGEAADRRGDDGAWSSVSVVARRYDINANLLFKWKRQDEAGQLGGPPATAEASEFVPIGVVGRTCDGGPALLARMPGIEDRTRPIEPSEHRQSAGLESRAGVIEIDLADGTRARVDAFVDARALARVLSALKRHA